MSWQLLPSPPHIFRWLLLPICDTWWSTGQKYIYWKGRKTTFLAESPCRDRTLLQAFLHTDWKIEVSSPKNVYWEAKMCWPARMATILVELCMYKQPIPARKKHFLSFWGKNLAFLCVSTGCPLRKYMAAVASSRSEYLTVRRWQTLLRTCCGSLPRTMAHWITMQPWPYQTCLDTR